MKIRKINRSAPIKGNFQTISGWGQNSILSPVHEGEARLQITRCYFTATHAAAIYFRNRWSDVGSWEALYDILDKDENGNILKTENITLSSKNNLVMSKKFVSMIGINNVALIETDNAILLVDINKTQDVKKIVDILKAEKRNDLL